MPFDFVLRCRSNSAHGLRSAFEAELRPLVKEVGLPELNRGTSLTITLSRFSLSSLPGYSAIHQVARTRGQVSLHYTKRFRPWQRARPAESTRPPGCPEP